MTIHDMRRRVLAHIRMAFALGWSTPLGLAARHRAALMRAQLVIARAAQ